MQDESVLFNKETMIEYFDGLRKALCYRFDYTWPKYIDNAKTMKGETRAVLMHPFNTTVSKVCEMGQAYANSKQIYYLYFYTFLMDKFGELSKVMTFMKAPQKHWDIVNSTCGLFNTLTHLGAARLERDYTLEEHKLALF